MIGRSLARSRARAGRRWLAGLFVAVLMVAAGSGLSTATSSSARPQSHASRILSDRSAKPPVFAYYYIWYTPGTWDRAKSDLPLLGKYSSDDPAVIAQHIQWAQDAGIDGFIVSWKHEPRLDAPLARLVAEAQRQNFKLILLYQGLDFSRNPIDPQRIGADLRWFSATYGSSPVFNVFGRPAVIWSGTWKFRPDQIAAVRKAVAAPQRLLLLGSERSPEDYAARRELFDGDAYYWSSADPQGTPHYEDRILGLGAEVAADGGKWIAPIVPGFDARLVGGSSVVPRRGGDTYRASWEAAARSRPDALGIISWNEFSENSHIEPSNRLGLEYLDVTARLAGVYRSGSTFTGPSAVPARGSVDSSDPVAEFLPGQRWISLVTAICLIVAFVLIVRRMRSRPA